MHDERMSVWGWGEASRFPDREQRTQMGQWASQVLGFAVGEAQDPAPLPSLPPPRLRAPDALRDSCSVQDADRARHAHGRSYPDIVRGFSGVFAHPPDVVARPRDEEDIAAWMRFCAAEGAALVPYGGGTSVVAGVEPDVGPRYSGVVSLDLGRLDRVLEIDLHSRAARIQAGATGPVLNAQLAASGLELRCFPQSYRFATLGGMLATRAGGHYATGRTHIDDLVESIRMVTPAGPFESRRLPGSGAGPSPDRLLLGSEGILGVITEAWMRVVRAPRFRASTSVLFADESSAINALRSIVQAELQPANCRLLDRTEAALNGVVSDGSHVLLLGFESADAMPAQDSARALELAQACGGQSGGWKHRDVQDASRDGTGAAWRDAFFEGPHLRDVLVSLGVIVDTFETACTWDRFAELDQGVREAVGEAMRATCGTGVIARRITHVYADGPAPYYTFLAPAPRDRELDCWAVIKEAASDALIRHGGTITHHHAVGRLHRSHYEQQRPELFAAVLRAAKDQLDPHGICNPGVLLAERG